MFEWLKRRLIPPAPVAEPVPPDEAMRRLRQVVSDAAFEDVWEAMDHEPRAVESPVRAALNAQELGEYPRYAALIWLGQTLAADGRRIDEDLATDLEEAIGWSLGFDENTVVLGAALGALDSFEPGAREALAVRLFVEAGATRPRRYWLLLKVRTEAMMELVVDALAVFEPPTDGPDPADEDFVYTPTAANRMAGAFRQFTADDFELARRFYDLESPGAQFLVEALGATQSERARPLLQQALGHERPAVHDAAARWLRVLG